MESITVGRWMEAKILELRRNRKKEIFDFPLLVRQDSPKIGSDLKSGKNFSHPPTPFCAPEWAALIRPWSGGSRGDQGLFFSFWSLSGEIRSQISRNFKIPEICSSKIFEFLIRSGISRSEIEFIPNRGPQRGSNRFGWEPE